MAGWLALLLMLFVFVGLPILLTLLLARIRWKRKLVAAKVFGHQLDTPAREYFKSLFWCIAGLALVLFYIYSR